MRYEDIQRHRVSDPEQEFFVRFPESRDAVVYEFEDEHQAQEARSVIVTAAMMMGRGRVVIVPWLGKQRLVAIAS